MADSQILEEWRPVPGYERLYEISNHGRLKEIDADSKTAGNIRSAKIAMTLRKDGEVKSFRTGRLVAMAFLPGSGDDDIELIHLDGNDYNNRVDNLKWASRSEGMHHRKQLREKGAYKATRERWTDNDTLPGEIWKPFPEFEELYEISNLGRVKELSTDGSGSYTIRECGKEVIYLKKDGKTFPRKVRRVLATAFVPNPDNKNRVVCLNGNEADYSIENLAWMTSGEANDHRLFTAWKNAGGFESWEDSLSLPGEVWRPINGFEGLYAVSSLGRIRSYRVPEGDESRWRIIKNLDARNGYLGISLTKGGKYYCKTLHRLVAETFIPNPEGKPQVNHIDSNRSNNRVENLEWVTASENIIHAFRAGRKNQQIERVRAYLKTEEGQRPVREYRKRIMKPVEAINLETGQKTIYESVNAAARGTNCHTPAVNAILHGRQKQSKGYVFRYLKSDS